METHEIKIEPEYIRGIINGKKRFELRYNDRNYKEGDRLMLREYKDYEYTINWVCVEVTSILHWNEFEGLRDGWCIMSIKMI